MAEQPSPPRQPTSTIEAAGQVASDVVAGLKQQPLMLALIVLNMLGIGAALWFLARLSSHNHETMQMILQSCLPAGGR